MTTADKKLKIRIPKSSIEKIKGEAMKSVHLYLHDKYLKNIPDIRDYKQLRVVYLHNNIISKIENLDNLYNITHLYLQWNVITQIEGLVGLANLKKLYLGNNCICVVENLFNLPYLEELHIEKQAIQEGESLCFDPRTITAISEQLRILDVSGNKLTSMDWINTLRVLEKLTAKDNLLESVNEVADNLCTLFNLRSVEFSGNPMAGRRRYRETLAARCYKLEVIDEKPVRENTRTFLKYLEMRNAKNKKRAAVKAANAANVEGGDQVLFHIEPPILKNDCLAYLEGYTINKEPQIKTLDYHGNRRPNVVPHRDLSLSVPRCFWRNKATPSAEPRGAADTTSALQAMLSLEGPPKIDQKTQRKLQGILKNAFPHRLVR